MKNHNSNEDSRGKKAELQALAENIMHCLEGGYENDVELGKNLEKAWKKFEGDKDAGKRYQEWVLETMGQKSTKAGGARQLYKLVNGEFKDGLAKVSKSYKAKLKTSMVGYALAKFSANKKIAEGKWNKPSNNLVEIDFQPNAIFLRFQGSDEVHDLLELKFDTLRELTTPKDPKKMKEALRNKVERLKRELDEAENELKEFEDSDGEPSQDHLTEQEPGFNDIDDQSEATFDSAVKEHNAVEEEEEPADQDQDDFEIEDITLDEETAIPVEKAAIKPGHQPAYANRSKNLAGTPNIPSQTAMNREASSCTHV